MCRILHIICPLHCLNSKYHTREPLCNAHMFYTGARIILKQSSQPRLAQTIVHFYHKLLATLCTILCNVLFVLGTIWYITRSMLYYRTLHITRRFHSTAMFLARRKPRCWPDGKPVFYKCRQFRAIVKK